MHSIDDHRRAHREVYTLLPRYTLRTLWRVFEQETVPTEPFKRAKHIARNEILFEAINASVNS